MPQRADEWYGAVLLFLFVSGLLWAPIGALICHLIARKKGLDAGSYAWAGLGYSALFFLPWMYLVARLLNIRIPDVIFYLVYAFFYLSWFILIAATVYLGLTEGDLGEISRRRGFGRFLLLILVWGAVVVMQAFTWLYSLQLLIQHHLWSRRNLGGAPRDIFPGGIYIYPFALFLGWLIVYAPLWAFTIFIISP